MILVSRNRPTFAQDASVHGAGMRSFAGITRTDMWNPESIAMLQLGIYLGNNTTL